MGHSHSSDGEATSTNVPATITLAWPKDDDPDGVTEDYDVELKLVEHPQAAVNSGALPISRMDIAHLHHDVKGLMPAFHKLAVEEKKVLKLVHPGKPVKEYWPKHILVQPRHPREGDDGSRLGSQQHHHVLSVSLEVAFLWLDGYRSGSIYRTFTLQMDMEAAE